MGRRHRPRLQIQLLTFRGEHAIIQINGTIKLGCPIDAATRKASSTSSAPAAPRTAASTIPSPPISPIPTRWYCSNAGVTAPRSMRMAHPITWPFQEFSEANPPAARDLRMIVRAPTRASRWADLWSAARLRLRSLTRSGARRSFSFVMRRGEQACAAPSRHARRRYLGSSASRCASSVLARQKQMRVDHQQEEAVAASLRPASPRSDEDRGQDRGPDAEQVLGADRPGGGGKR